MIVQKHRRIDEIGGCKTAHKHHTNQIRRTLNLELTDTLPERVLRLMFHRVETLQQYLVLHSGKNVMQINDFVTQWVAVALMSDK